MDFKLKPFSPDSTLEITHCKGSLIKDTLSFKLEYVLKGNMSQLKGLVSQKSLGRRKNDLWKNTCFELFLKESSETNYEEYNFSSAGDWNSYSLKGYREDLQEINSTLIEHFSTVLLADSFHFVVRFKSILANSTSLEFNPCVILEKQNGEKSYWSLNHCNPQKADFHLTEAFIKYEGAPK